MIGLIEISYGDRLRIRGKCIGWARRRLQDLKMKGGLGLQTAKGRNTALLAKLNWRFHTKDKASWAKVLRMKYCSPQRLNSRNASKLPSSRIWKGMLRGVATFKEGIKWLPGFESNLEVWNDNWTNFGPLRSIIQGLLSREAANLKIKDVMDETSRWNWFSFQMSFPDEVLKDIMATPIPFSARCEDRLAWKHSAKGDFDLRSAYLLAMDTRGDAPFKGQWIWKLKILPRIQMFVWKCMHFSLGVNQCLLDRGLMVEAYYPWCQCEVESILHLLRDCPFSIRVWNQLGGYVNNSNFFSLSLQDWLFSNATSNLHHNSGPLPWNLVFFFSLWLLWKDRNMCVFNQKNPNPNLNKDIVDRAAEFFFCAYNGLVTKRMITKSIRWEKPRARWLTLNIDGSTGSNSGPAGGGGLVRDENGNWVKGFARRIGNTSSYLAELWALRDGL